MLGQKVYNNEVKAKINIVKTGEFVTFTATAENLEFSDLSLRYEFMVFKVDGNNNSSKTSQANRFFLKGNEKKILSSVTINNNSDDKSILLLLIYPLESADENQGAIGKDRLVVYNDGQGGLKIELDNEQKITEKEQVEDQDTSSKDGFFLEGLVLQKTLTKPGRDFYRYFYSEYYNKQIKSEKNIIIEEVPGQRRSTRISVKVDGQLVWQFFSRPKKEFLKEMASTALNRCTAYLQQLAQQKQTLTRY
ncbi:MAG: hypothetical protein KBT58_06815 [Bizionia sp.]|nr:hypothetical protein [Bizionia sp.]